MRFGTLACGALLWLAGCGRAGDGAVTIRFWVMGREGEIVQELVDDFEREHPQIRVQVQQIPWSAAHEKLLTAYVGRATPDLAQLGNTWVPEFAALGALAPLDDPRGGLDRGASRRPFPRHLGHQPGRRPSLRPALVRGHPGALLPHRPAGGRRLGPGSAHLERVA